MTKQEIVVAILPALIDRAPLDEWGNVSTWWCVGNANQIAEEVIKQDNEKTNNTTP